MSVTSRPARDGVADDGRIKVLFLMIQMAMGGAERLILNLIRHLDTRVFAPSLGWFVEERPLKEFEELNIPLYYIPKRSRFDWGTMRTLGQVVREHRIDVINAHHFMPFVYAYYGATIANHASLVYTEHSESDVLAARGPWRMAGTYLLRSCDAVGISEHVSSTLASHFRLNPERVHTIENGVDVDTFGKRAADRDGLRAKFGFGSQDTVVGLVANFRKNKNHLFLLKAFRELVQRRPQVRLVFVGQGFPHDPQNSEPEISAYILEHGLERSVQLMGYRPDVQEVLQAMDLCCLVSYKEGLPLSLIEAMASGLPVIGTDIEGIRGVIRPGENGLLVVPDDVAALTNALSSVIDDAGMSRRMGAASQRIAREKYALTRSVEETQRLFLSLARGDFKRNAVAQTAIN